MKFNWIVSFRILLALSLLMIALPYIIFAVQRATGGLMSQQDWLALEQAKGPWTGKWQGFTIFFPIIVLAPITLAAAIFLAVVESHWRPIVGALGLIALHAAALIFQVETLVWLIDSASGA